jgi:hypothetical protein
MSALALPFVTPLQCAEARHCNEEGKHSVPAELVALRDDSVIIA